MREMRNVFRTYFNLFVNEATSADFEQAQKACSLEQRKQFQAVLLTLGAWHDTDAPISPQPKQPDHLLTHWSFAQFECWYHQQLWQFFQQERSIKLLQWSAFCAAFDQFLLYAARADFERSVVKLVPQLLVENTTWKTPLPVGNCCFPNSCWLLSKVFSEMPQRSSHTDYFIQQTSAQMGWFVFNHTRKALRVLATDKTVVECSFLE